jgi:hypothetical protein
MLSEVETSAFSPYDIGESPPMSFVNVFGAGAENFLRVTILGH